MNEQGALVIRKKEGDPIINENLILPIQGDETHLHSQISIHAEALRLGPNPWDSGRVLLVWRDSGHQVLKITPIGSAEDWESHDDLQLVTQIPPEGSTQELVFQHLGSSGILQIDQLELTPVTETPWWKYGRWILVVGWLGWFAQAVAIFKPSTLRVASASFLLLVLFATLAFPGPWKPLRPIGGAFALNSPQEVLDAASDAPSSSAAKAPTNKIDRKDTLIVRLKHKFKQLRPLLHGGLFTLVALSLAILIGTWGAGALSGFLALAIELTQVGYGFSWDLKDTGDLVCNLLGVALALAVFKWLQPHLAKRFSAVPQ